MSRTLRDGGRKTSEGDGTRQHMNRRKPGDCGISKGRREAASRSGEGSYFYNAAEDWTEEGGWRPPGWHRGVVGRVDPCGGWGELYEK